MEALTLVSNPGSASRKYALYAGNSVRATLHFEYTDGRVLCTLVHGEHRNTEQTDLQNVEQAAQKVLDMFTTAGVLTDNEKINRIGLRVVAPGSFFLEHHIIDDAVLGQLRALEPRAPLHIAATLQELYALREQFATTVVVGVSDSAFHITKPDFAWNYGINLEDADRLDIKRFGYHGLSVMAAVHALKSADRLPAKLVVCHLGSGASVTAVYNGKSIDTTMGFSPLEGLIMATRVGSIDVTAAHALKDLLGFDDAKLEDYLNHHGGLLGLSGTSSDIRELLVAEQAGNHRAELALNTYAHSVQKGIGEMAAVLGGIDVLVFTGTVGERSAPMRERIVHPLHFIDLVLDTKANAGCTNPTQVVNIGRLAHSKPIFVIPTDEAAQIAHITNSLT
jgi:acetate kinase